METRAPFIIVGAFVLAAIGAVFGFVYWLHNTGSLGSRTTYHVQFNGPVPGLLVGGAVLFNGIRVGEVTELSLAADSPRRVDAAIAVGSGTPVRADTKVGLDFQGLTGVPVVALEGGKELAASGQVPTLIAEPGAGQSMTHTQTGRFRAGRKRRASPEYDLQPENIFRGIGEKYRRPRRNRGWPGTDDGRRRSTDTQDRL